MCCGAFKKSDDGWGARRGTLKKALHGFPIREHRSLWVGSIACTNDLEKTLDVCVGWGGGDEFVFRSNSLMDGASVAGMAYVRQLWQRCSDYDGLVTTMADV